MASSLIRSAAQGLLAVIASQTAWCAGPNASCTAARDERRATADKWHRSTPHCFEASSIGSSGHSRGGRVTTVTGVPSQPRTFYMGVASGGLFRTTDGGENWEPLTDGKVPVASTGSVAVADRSEHHLPRHRLRRRAEQRLDGPRRVQIGRRRQDAGQFIGLYNAGRSARCAFIRPTRTSSGSRPTATSSSLTTNAACSRRPTAAKTWKKTLYVTDSTGAMDVELQPGNPNVVYAWMNRIERKPWSIISGSREGGFYKSTDGGETWTKDHAGLPTELIGKAQPGGHGRESRSASTRWSRRSRVAVCTAPMTRGRPGRR